MAVTLDTRPHGVELLAVRVGSSLERWGRERAEHRALVAGRLADLAADPETAAALLAAREHARSTAAPLTRIR
jgi:hypothetical protein